jgi:hypothetical protein
VPKWESARKTSYADHGYWVSLKLTLRLAAVPLRCAERLCLSGPAQTITCWQGCALPASVYEGERFGKAKPFRTTERHSRKNFKLTHYQIMDLPIRPATA